MEGQRGKEKPIAEKIELESTVYSTEYSTCQKRINNL